MPQLAANISTLFLELPIEDRPLAAARAGFEAVELRFLDPGPLDGFIEDLRASGLELVMFKGDPGDLSQGELGLAAVSDQLERFKKSLLVDFA